MVCFDLFVDPFFETDIGTLKHTNDLFAREFRPVLQHNTVAADPQNMAPANPLKTLSEAVVFTMLCSQHKTVITFYDIVKVSGYCI